MSFVACCAEWMAGLRPPSDLQVEFDSSPIALDIAAPRFSWIMPVKERGQGQSGYHLLVATHPDWLLPGRADMWDTGIVMSAATTHVVYAGAPLVSNRDYAWRVRIRDQAGRWGRWSRVARFSTAFCSPEEWKADWIGHCRPDEIVADVALFVSGRIPPAIQSLEQELRSPLLRREFVLVKPVKRARAFVSGLGLYELRLNGGKVGDRVLAPARSEYRKRIYYDTYDVTRLLRQGANALGLMLGNGWFNGPKRYWGWQMQWYGHPRAILQLELEYADGATDRVISDGAWHCAWGPITFNCLFDGEDYDARLEQAGWDRPGFDEQGWEVAQVAPAPGGILCSALHQADRVMQTIKAVAVREPQPGAHVFDLGVNFSGWVRLAVRGSKGARIRMRFAEGVHPDGTIDTETMGGARAELNYTLQGRGLEIYEPRFTYGGFQYVEVTGYPGQPLANAIEGRFVHTALAPNATFECADEAMNHVHRCMLVSQRSNFHMAVPTDDCQRPERLGWGADAWISAPQAMLNFDTPRFYAKWLRDFRDQQAPSGAVGMIAPLANIEEDHVWSCAYIFIPWYHYVRTGDRRLLEEHYDGLAAYLDYLATQGCADIAFQPQNKNPPHDPLTRTDTTSGHLLCSQWGDHLSTAPGHAMRSGLPLCITTAYYYQAAEVMEQIARVLGKNDDAARFARLAGDIRAAYNRKFFDAATGRYDNGTQAPQAWALDFGLAPEGREDAVAKALLDDLAACDWHVTTGFPGTSSLVNALMALGRADIVWRLANQPTYPSWCYMLRGRTSVPETWGGTGSWNHHALVSPLDQWFFTGLAGIRPDARRPGYAHMEIRPWAPPDLEWINVALNTVRGRVAVAWRQTQGTLRLDLSIPANATATVHIPTVDAGMVAEGGRPVGQVEGVTPLGLRGNALVLDVVSGEYAFTSRIS